MDSKRWTWLVRKLLAALGDPPISIEQSGSVVYAPPRGEPKYRVVVHAPRIFGRLFFDPIYEFGEAYRQGSIEIDGDLIEFLCLMYGCLVRNEKRRISDFLRAAIGRIRHPIFRNSTGRSRENIHHHYDIGNDFYKLWLDDQLLYTCAYFPSPSLTLEQAQIEKMDHVCRKLQLMPGDEVIEAGCGWGAFALHMARNYGARVRAINISREQIAYARKQARSEGLDDKVEFLEADWREIRGQYDVFVSIGMLEHVGIDNYKHLGQVIHECLKPHGRALVHSIGRNFPSQLDPWIRRRIFPGAFPPSLKQAMDIFEPLDFSVLDIENLRRHYALTLRHWLRRFEESKDKVLDMFDEEFVRTWRLYLAGSVAAFESSNLQLFQILFCHGRNNQIPLTRSHVYLNGVTKSCK